MTHKKHNSAPALGEIVCNISQGNARSSNAVNKDDLLAILGAKLIDADGAIL